MRAAERRLVLGLVVLATTAVFVVWYAAAELHSRRPASPPVTITLGY